MLTGHSRGSARNIKNIKQGGGGVLVLASRRTRRQARSWVVPGRRGASEARVQDEGLAFLMVIAQERDDPGSFEQPGGDTYGPLPADRQMPRDVEGEPAAEFVNQGGGDPQAGNLQEV